MFGQGKAVLIQTTCWGSGDSVHRVADMDSSMVVDRSRKCGRNQQGEAPSQDQSRRLSHLCRINQPYPQPRPSVWPRKTLRDWPKTLQPVIKRQLQTRLEGFDFTRRLFPVWAEKSKAESLLKGTGEGEGIGCGGDLNQLLIAFNK